MSFIRMVAWVLAVAAIAACAENTEPPATGVTFSKQVVRLLQEHCQSCHHADGHAPFPLTTYEEAEPYAQRMKAAVADRIMPEARPMRLDSGCADEHTFVGPRQLTYDEIATFAAWADAGAPAGNVRDLPPLLDFNDDVEWKAGTPQMIFANASTGFTLPGAVGRDVFRRFVIPTSFATAQYITGFEAEPGTPDGERLGRVVHHVTLFVDPLRKSTDQEATFQASSPQVPGPGFEGEFTYPVDLVGMWFPGSAPLMLTAGCGIRVPAGANIVMEVHYGKTDSTVTDQTRVGLHLKDAVDIEIKGSLVKNENITIPAGSTDTVIKAERRIDAPFTLYALTPHMHQLGTDFEVEIEIPGSGPACFADVAWNFEHQNTYWLRQPRDLPAGTIIRTTCKYDNSATNPNQFNVPPKDIVFGKVADLEMCQLTIATTPIPPPAPPPPPAAGALVINEVLADPPVDYDANGDGVLDPSQDEFVELVNAGTGPLDLSGATISDSVGVRTTLPASTTLAAGEVLVMFSGGTPAPIAGVRVMTASAALQLNNAGDTLTVKSAAGAVLGTVTWAAEGGADQSLVRATEKSATAAFVGHKSVSTAPASPGKRADGTAL